MRRERDERNERRNEQCGEHRRGGLGRASVRDRAFIGCAKLLTYRPVQELLTTENLVALLTLAALEIVLGIDNVVFISILSGKLPKEQQGKARKIGLFLAMFVRILLLLAISWVMGLTKPLFSDPFFDHPFSGRDLILLVGGIFLIAKAVTEIHDKLEGAEHGGPGARKVSFNAIIMQIVALDIVFSLDSVITAVGMASKVEIMIAAVVISVVVMLIFAGRISAFIERHPTMKMLALSFLLLIGVMLAIEGFGKHVEKGYIYAAMAFSLFVEVLNMRLRRKAPPVHLHQKFH
ncbi:MAG: TerC family protein [Planctomycetota bacterium]|nr:MAG: TerC family protein [Planctomycetota bacterium]